MRHRSKFDVVLKWIVIVIALILGVGPVLYGFLLSLRPFSSVITNPLDVVPSLDEISLSAYSSALLPVSEGGFGFGSFIRNSLLIALVTVILAVLASIFGAYATARMNFRGRKVANGMILAIYLFPGIVLAVPLFVMLSRLGLTGNLVGLMIVYVALTVPVSLYMIRNYFMALPESIEEAAVIDGCSLPRMLFSVVLPVSLPGIAATAIYVFMVAWNEYLYALLFLVQTRPLWTAPLGLAQLADFNVPVTVLLAGSIIVTIPVIIAFFFSQKYLVAGLTAGAEKG